MINKFVKNNRAQLPIAIMDSGVGGLSIMKTINEQLPNESLIYVADTLFAPYGEKSVTAIQQRCNLLTEQLLQAPIKALVLACNTATVNAIDQLRIKFPQLPIIGVEPAIKPAASLSHNKKIGLLVTQATAVNQRFLRLVRQHSQDAEVFIQACPGLVQLIEQGRYQSPQCVRLLNQYLKPLIAQQIDTLVLGCTHYPFLSSLIHQITGAQVTLLETALPVSKELKRRLIQHHLLASTQQSAPPRFFTTADSLAQQSIFNQLWQTETSLESFPWVDNITA
jgi:glutamate racemase